MTLTEAKWRSSLKHLHVALERVIHNFAEHAGITKKVAAGHVERIAKEIRERDEQQSPPPAGPSPKRIA